MGYAGQLLIADELPAIVNTVGANGNTITATSWAVLPGGSVTAVMTNPSATRNLVCWLDFGAEATASASDVRMAVGLSGGMTVLPGAVEPSWAYRVWTATASVGTYTMSIPITIPAGASAVTATLYAYRPVASGTQNIGYPSLTWIPLHYAMP